ncbi:MAG TPA: hypothetical protein VGM56_22240 [Byssovorax sp.]
MNISKDAAARELAEWHLKVEPALERVYRIVTSTEDAPGEPIKLLEVNPATVTTGSVEPFAFGASREVPFPTVIAEVTPEEFTRIEQKQLSLPQGWSLEDAQVFTRPAA